MLARLARTLAHVKAAVAPRLHQPLGQQLVIRPHHRGRAHTLLLRTLPHRRQPRTGRQQAVPDTLGKAQGELLSQGLGAAFHQHLKSLRVCASSASSTVLKMLAKTVL
jgi:hypothetical protein